MYCFFIKFDQLVWFLAENLEQFMLFMLSINVLTKGDFFIIDVWEIQSRSLEYKFGDLFFELMVVPNEDAIGNNEV